MISSTILLRKWSIPERHERNPLRVLASLVPEDRSSDGIRDEHSDNDRRRNRLQSQRSARSLDSSVRRGRWFVAADDAGSLRQLITELEALAAKKTGHADFVLTLAKIRDTRTADADLIAKLTSRVAPEADSGELTALHDAVLVSVATTRTGLGPVCEQIVERLNQFDFTKGDFAACVIF